MSLEDAKTSEDEEILFSWTGFMTSVLFGVFANSYLIVFVVALGVEARWREMSLFQIFVKNTRDSLEVFPLTLYVLPFAALLYLPISLIGLAFANSLGCYSKRLAATIGMVSGLPATILAIVLGSSNWQTIFAAATCSLSIGAISGLLFRASAIAKSSHSNKELSLL